MSYILTNEVKNYINQSIGTDNCTITIESTTQKGEGYGGDLIFAKVELNQSPTEKMLKEEDKVLYVVLKRNNQNPAVQIHFPILNESCKREVDFYGRIIPVFQNFCISKIPNDSLNIVPKCYKAFLGDENNVIVLEDLKKKSYVLHPRDKPMNSDHIKICLRAYAKLHALSFAMQDQSPEIFSRISDNFLPLMSEGMKQCKPLFDSKSVALVDTLNEAGRADLSSRYEKFIKERSIFNRYMDVCDANFEEKVVTHADCHNANMLFLYKDNNRNNPQQVSLIDFQVACLHSPIIDVSAFLHFNLSSEGFLEFNDFLEFYFNELSSFLSQMGSDITKLFSKPTMLEHVKKCLPYGFCVSIAFLELLYIDNEDAPSLIDEKTNEVMGGLKDLKLNSREQYLKRITSTVEHFLNNIYA